MVSFTYDVFGKRTVEYQANGSTNPGQIELLTQMKADLLNPFAYRGYCYDYDMGMYYLQSRYYDPNTGRFINADDTNYLNATGTVLGCNLFAYCENDPVNNVDPKGTISFSGKNPKDGTKSALRKFAKNVLKNEKNISIDINMNGYLYYGKITYQNKKKQTKSLKYDIGTQKRWQFYTNIILDKDLSIANDFAWASYNEIVNVVADGAASWPVAFYGGISLGLYAGSEIKYKNFKKIFDSVYGPNGLDPQNVRYYFLLRVSGEKKYKGWYAIPDSVGRVVKVK